MFCYFVLFVRVGEKVPFAKKGRFGVVSGSVEEFFCPFHLQIETSSTDDLDEELLMHKVILATCTLVIYVPHSECCSVKNWQ